MVKRRFTFFRVTLNQPRAIIPGRNASVGVSEVEVDELLVRLGIEPERGFQAERVEDVFLAEEDR